MKSPAFQFYPNDLLADPKTLVMTAEEIGAYWLLICACWNEDGLPNDEKKLARLARTQQKKFARMWKENISACFYFDADTNTWRHNRLDKERVKQRSNSKKRKVAADARWKKKKCKSNANALQTEYLSTSTSTSTTNIDKNTFVNTDADANAENSPLHGRGFPIKDLLDAFPHLYEFEFTSAQIGMIESEVTLADKRAWQNTLGIYKGNYNPARNYYLPEKFGTLLKVFRDEKRKLEKERNELNAKQPSNLEQIVTTDYSEFEGVTYDDFRN